MRRGPPKRSSCYCLVSLTPSEPQLGHRSSSPCFVGAGESGKSTVLKQMRLIYSQGFSKTEKEEWRTIIFNNLLGAFKIILDAMDELDIELDVELNDVSTHAVYRLSIFALTAMVFPTVLYTYPGRLRFGPEGLLTTGIPPSVQSLLG
jgi:hypothetical protein